MTKQLLELNSRLNNTLKYIKDNYNELLLKNNNIINIQSQLKESKAINIELIQRIKYVNNHNKKIKFTGDFQHEVNLYITELDKSLYELTI